MMCVERLRLFNDYRDATRTYSDSVSKMTDLVGLGLGTEVNVLRGACRGAWEATEKARVALSRHEADHCCDRNDFFASAAASASQPR